MLGADGTTVVGVRERADHRLPRLARLSERRHRLLDLGIVALVLIFSLAPDRLRGHTTADALFDLALALPLLWRRRAPVAVFGVIAAVALVQWFAGVRAFGDCALLVALYTVAVTQPLPTTLVASGVLEAGIVMAALRWTGGIEGTVKAIVALTGMATAAGVLGTNVRHRRELLASLHERATRLERERDQQGRLSAAAERARIAREMHDIVAHNLSVMIALADGASFHVRDAPERAEAALGRAAQTGREALAEMRRLLGVLREEPVPGAREPQPGIEQLDALVEQIRAAGVPVAYEVAGSPGRVERGLQLAVYRIVQEALTNTLKHAGAGAGARVRVAWDGETVDIDVRDTGTAPAVPGVEGGGLRGMRERAAVYGGVVQAGPAEPGGWRVWTRLTIPAAAAGGVAA
jgi:signal transduction histidine kinase